MTDSPKTTNVPILLAEEPWVNVSLSDGTQLRLRTIITAVRRIDDKTDDYGNPMYIVNSSTTAVVTEKRKIQ